VRRHITIERAVMVVYAVGIFMSTMDTQIVNVALSTIGLQFGATAARVQWVVTGYLLGLAVMIPVSVWVGDRLGAKRTYIGAVALFTLASALCAASSSLPELVVARVLQGAGAGAIIPVGTALLYRTFPPSRRVSVARRIVLFTAIAPATAPIIGGVLITTLSWHWVFLINIPVGLAVCVFGACFLPPSPVRKAERFDGIGFMLGSGGLAALLLSLSEGATVGWSAPTTVAAAVGGITSLAAFTAWSLSRERPLLRLRVLSDRGFRISCALIALGTTAFSGSLIITALYLQQGRGFSAIASGVTTFRRQSESRCPRRSWRGCTRASDRAGCCAAASSALPS
jgi:EmrB/QacA subfamily drug resistance transporter